MKKLTIIIALLISTLTFSQVQIGIKAGANMSIYGQDFPDEHYMKDHYKYKTGFYIGAFANVPIEGSLSIQMDALFSQTGTIFDDENYNYGFKRTVNDYAISVPAMLKYGISKFYVEAGGQVNFGLGRTYNYSGSDYGAQMFTDPRGLNFDANDGKHIVYGAIFGIGYDLTEHFSLGARYFIESKNDDYTEISRVISFGIAYTF